MATDHAERLWNLLAAGIAPPSSDPAWRWMEGNIWLDHTSAMPGRYDTALTPFVRYIYDALQNPRVRRITCLISAQSFKSQLMLNFFAWCLINDPGQAMWVMANAEMCEDFIETRLKRLLENCDATRQKMPLTRSENRKDLIQFPSMDLLVRGSNSRQKLQSTPIRRIFCDERADWRAGAIEDVRKRMGTFHNSLEISAGTGGIVGDSLTNDFLEGSQTHCHFRCLACQHSQPWRFGREPSPLFPHPRSKGGLRWDTNETTRPGGVWKWEEVVKTVRWECEECGHGHAPSDKPAMIATIHAVDHNPAASEKLKSFQSNVFSMPWADADWRGKVVEWLKALDARQLGDLEPMKAFITKVLGEPWRESMAQPDLTDTFDLIREPYGWNEVWPAEATRFMGVDCQAKGGDHFWWAIRSISSTGQRRLVAYGKALTFEQLEEVRKSYGVPVTNAVIDHGYKGATVARFCAATGWKPMKGEEDAHFTARVNGKAVRRYWQATKINPQLGQKASGPRREVTLYRWSNPSFKDLLNNCLTGLTPGFSVPLEPGKDWLSHMSAEQRVEEKNSRGELVSRWQKIRDDDHLRDCELMILAAMHIAAHFGKCPHPMGGVMREPGPN